MSDSFLSLDIHVIQGENDLYIALSGRLVRNACPDLEEVINQHFSTSLERLIIGMHEVTFIDSAGLGLLVAQKVRCTKEGIQFLILDPSPQLEEVILVSRLHMIFPVLRGPQARRMRVELENRDEIVSDASTRVPDNERIDPILSDVANRPPQTPLLEEDCPDLSDLCRQAVELVRRGEYEQAVEVYKEVLQKSPEHLSALNNLALLYEKKPLWMPLAMQTWKRVEDLSVRLNDSKHLLRAQRRQAVLKNDPLIRPDALDSNQETIIG